MTTALVALNADQCFSLAERVARSNLLPAAYRGKPTETAIAMLYGAEIGLPPMTSLQRIVVVEGKPTLDAQGMVARIRGDGHSLSGEMGPAEAIVIGVRADTGDTMTVRWTIEMARAAGLANKDVWKKYPASMLWARAVSQLARALFADVLMGVSYTPEEMQDVVDDGPASTGAQRPAPASLRTEETVLRPPPGAPAAAPVVHADPETGEVVDPDEGIVDAEIVETGSAEAVAEVEVEPVPVEATPVTPSSTGGDARNALEEIINGIEPPAQRTALRAYLRSQFGQPGQRTPEQIASAIDIAAGWPETGPADEDGVDQ